MLRSIVYEMDVNYPLETGEEPRTISEMHTEHWQKSKIRRINCKKAIEAYQNALKNIHEESYPMYNKK